MTSIRSIRRWADLHKWSSLVCSAFLLLICVTGLPLVFGHEIDDWLDPDPPHAELPAGTPNVSVDRLVAKARGMFPGEIITSVFVDDDEPHAVVALAPSWAESRANPRSNHFVMFDSRTGEILKQSDPPGQRRRSLIAVLRRLHIDMFAGLTGALFMGAMGLAFVASLASGVVLYGPIMRRLDFGTLRLRRPARIRWLDLHNLLGIVTLAWALVVGLTGIMNELSRPLFALWQQTVVRDLVAPWKAYEAPRQDELTSLQAAFDTAKAALPGMVVLTLVMPGSDLGSPHHFLIWAKGESQLTARLFSPVLVDAKTGGLTSVVEMPWYLRALQVSRPLHFGDYGGLPLKVVWVMLDLVTIVVLASGIYLWLSRRRSTLEDRMAELQRLADAP